MGDNDCVYLKRISKLCSQNYCVNYERFTIIDLSEILFHAILISAIAVGISRASMSKLGRNESVLINVLAKICTMLQCDICDIMEHIN